MGNFNPEEYETVESRIKRFYSDHPDGCIRTELLSSPNEISTAVVLAYVYTDHGEILRATGMAFEQAGQGFVNKTSHLENCETSAIGRALANYNYSGDKRPSREEMDKTQGAPTQAKTEAKTAPKKPANDADGLFQTIVKNKDRLGDSPGVAMNAALDARTKGDVETLKKIMEEHGIG